MNSVYRWLLDLLYPPRCVLCHRMMDSSAQSLCGHCLEELPEYDGPLRKVPYFDKVVAPFYCRLFAYIVKLQNVLNRLE